MEQHVTSVPDFGTPKTGREKTSQNDTNVYQNETNVYRFETNETECPEACQRASGVPACLRRASVPHAC